MTRPLEHLLEVGDSVTYGQLCWSLGNRDTIRYQAGDEITLGGWEGSGRPLETSFQLTEETIENINRCLGMRSCGEASALFTPPPEEVEPREECPHGHKQAAWEYMMYGIRPTKPCPECGEIPAFYGGAMSLDFRSREPVKGVDGNEYQICPECGDDMLELHGDDPVGWGWTIACLNCGWEIKQAEELDIYQYSDLMEEIKLKVEAIQRVMEMPGIINQTRVETACLQLRMVLELIVFSSLVSNKDAWQKSQDELRRAWNIKKIMGDLRGIHSRYYPEPKGKRGDFLTEERLVTVYDQLNKIIHAENPIGPRSISGTTWSPCPNGWSGQRTCSWSTRSSSTITPMCFTGSGCSEDRRRMSSALPSGQRPTEKNSAHGRIASRKETGSTASTSKIPGRNASCRNWTSPDRG